MGFRIEKATADGVQGLDPTLFVLHGPDGARAEVWPALGFNCFKWLAPRGGALLDLLYADPALFTGGRPTRSGVPVLFPFPNRIRDGRFSWAGKDYALELNDPAKKNAAHGWACRVPWKVVEHGADESGAWITGEYHGKAENWPAEHLLTLTIKLGRGTLRFDAEVTNLDKAELPFGLGYHPYFRIAPEAMVEVPAAKMWPAAENLPTGEPVAVDAGRDLNRPRLLSSLELDDVLTDLPKRAGRMDGLIERAALGIGEGQPLRMFCSPAFREMVVYTPPHRQAFAVEPYTCTTDAVNLQARGLDAGWLVLPPGEQWKASVELWV
ncbi:MAG: aldose 1-epimerase [Gemmataceae bacterium]|nr:aldose 1-epimerase [Gemmataceae bacterium]